MKATAVMRDPMAGTPAPTPMRKPLDSTVAAALLMATLSLAGCSGGSSASASSSATTSESSPSALSVQVVAPSTEQWSQSLKATGQIFASQEIAISPETGGLRLKEMRVEVGAHVRRGQVLAVLADDSLHAERHKLAAAVDQARVTLEQATSNVQRSRMAEDSGALSAQKIEEYRLTEASAKASLAAARAELESTDLKLAQTRVQAPDDGIVSSKTGVLGSVVSAGTELFRLVRHGQVEWRPEIDARQLTLVKPGQKARITLPTGQVVQGELRIVGPTLSASTARATLYVNLPENGPARAGMFASGVLLADPVPALNLPQSAVVMRDGRAYVYLVDAGSLVHARPVATGRREGDRIEVVSGLDAGARVVASGGGFLSEGARVTVLPAQAGPSAGAESDKPGATASGSAR